MPNRFRNDSRASRACVPVGKRLPDTPGTSNSRLKRRRAMGRCAQCHAFHSKSMGFTQKHGFSRKVRILKNFQDFSKIHDFFMKNKSCQIGSGMILGHPGHVCPSGNDSQTLRGPPTRASSGGGRWVGVHSIMRFEGKPRFSKKTLKIHENH